MIGDSLSGEAPDGQGREDYYLVVGALAPYKRVDQAVDAFARLGKPLRVIGAGQQRHVLARGLPDNITYLGWQSDESIREQYRRCRALIFPVRFRRVASGLMMDSVRSMAMEPILSLFDKGAAL